MNELQSLQNDVDTIINAKVKQNNARQITGIVLNGVLRSITAFVITAIGLFYTKKEIDDKFTAIELTPGPNGQSAYQVWQTIAGNENKTIEEYEASLKGIDGEPAPTVAFQYSVDGLTEWHTTATENDFYLRISNDNSVTWGNALKFKGSEGINGKSAFEVWQGIAGNENKTIEEYEASLKGQSAFTTVSDVTRETATLYDEVTLAYYPIGKDYFGNTYKYFVIRQIGDIKLFVPLGITFIGTDDNGINVFDPITEQYILIRTWLSLNGPSGKNAFEVWQTIEGNESKTIEDYEASLKGSDGRNAFEVWQAIAGNENKTADDFWIFLSQTKDFAFNLALDTDTSVLFSSPKALIINAINLINVSSATYSIDGGSAIAIVPGTVVIDITANSLIKFTVVYTAGKTQAIINISGIYN